MKFFYQFAITISLILLSSCAHGPVESVNAFLGTSIKPLEEARNKGNFWIYDHPIDKCFEAALKVIVNSKAKIYMQNKSKGIIVALDFKRTNFASKTAEQTTQTPLNEIIDTTELGIFFTRLEDNKTKLELSSESTPLLEFVSGFIFKDLEDLLKKNV